MRLVHALKFKTRETYHIQCLEGIKEVVGCAIQFLCVFPRHNNNPVIDSWDSKNWIL